MTPQSDALMERARRVLAGGVSSEFRKAGARFWESAAGARIVDVDGNAFIDFALSQGPMVLGHSHPEVLAAVAEASARGQLFAGQHRLELELAETLQRRIPCAERLRFALSGSEAVHAALRAARAATGRAKFVRFLGHYHGWLDSVAFGIAGPGAWSEGLADHSLDGAIVLPWNDLSAVDAALAAHGHEIAALITEPVMGNSGCVPPAPGFLEGLRQLTERHGVALIFDEVITGFRLGLSGAQGRFGVTPDLAVFGKAMASGYPIAALCGREPWMRPVADGRAIHAGTMNSGNPCVAAALATVRILERDNPYPELDRLGTRLADGLRALSPNWTVQNVGPMVWVGFTDRPVADLAGVQRCDREKLARFVDGLLARGVRTLTRGMFYVCAAHTDADVDAAIDAACTTLETMR